MPSPDEVSDVERSRQSSGGSAMSRVLAMPCPLKFELDEVSAVMILCNQACPDSKVLLQECLRRKVYNTKGVCVGQGC